MAAEISVITQDTAESCLDLAACVFAARSTLHQVAGIDADVYRDRLYPAFMHNIAQGLSVAAWENGEVLGALIACDIRDQGAVIPDPRLRAMHALMHEMEERYLATMEIIC